MGLPLTFPRPLKEKPDDEDLQAGHADHQSALHHAEVEDPALGALDRAEVSILARAEVLLVAVDGGEVAGDFEDGLFERGGLFGGGALF